MCGRLGGFSPLPVLLWSAPQGGWMRHDRRCQTGWRPRARDQSGPGERIPRGVRTSFPPRIADGRVERRIAGNKGQRGIAGDRRQRRITADKGQQRIARDRRQPGIAEGRSQRGIAGAVVRWACQRTGPRSQPACTRLDQLVAERTVGHRGGPGGAGDLAGNARAVGRCCRRDAACHAARQAGGRRVVIARRQAAWA